MVAPRKTSSGLSLISEERSRNMPSSSKSTESLYSNTSSSKGSATVLYRRNGLAGGTGRPGAFIPAATEVRQRVLSARRLRIKTFQNQLADAQQHIAELAHENRMLSTLHKRQDLALSKYESTNAELPQLLHSHAEEVRVWQTKYRNIQTQNKQLLHKLKQKEGLILSLSDQNKHLTQLNKDKNLEERQQLSDKVQHLEMRLQEKETDMKLMARKLQLESKSSKKELHTEQKKRKDALVQLEKVKLELSGYVKIDELNLNDKLSKLSIGSLTNLNATHANEDRLSLSQTVLLPLEKKPNELAGDQSNRSTSTNRSEIFLSTGRTTRKLSGNKLVGKTSTHRGNGDGPSDEDQNIFLKSVGIESTTESQIDIEQSETKSEDASYYDEDYETIDEGADADDIENLLELTRQEIKTPKTAKLDSMSSIRKEITEDFKERESFLKTFCRQTSADSVKMNVNRKSKLLAALKVIDGDATKN